MVDRGVPVASDGVVSLILGDVDQARIIEGTDDIHCPVCGIVVNHYHIVREIRLLAQSGADGICNGPDAVLARNHHRGLVLEVSLVQVHIPELRFKIGPDSLQMGCAGLFHFYLDLSVAGIDIVKLLLARLARIKLHLVIQVLRHPDQFTQTRNFQAKVIQTGKFIVLFIEAERLPEEGAAVELDCAEVEIVP